jgi:hypothetical protein
VDVSATNATPDIANIVKIKRAKAATFITTTDSKQQETTMNSTHYGGPTLKNPFKIDKFDTVASKNQSQAHSPSRSSMGSYSTALNSNRRTNNLKFSGRSTSVVKSSRVSPRSLNKRLSTLQTLNEEPNTYKPNISKLLQGSSTMTATETVQSTDKKRPSHGGLIPINVFEHKQSQIRTIVSDCI